MNINRLLVKRLQISTQESVRFIDNKMVLIDGVPAIQKQKVSKINKVICHNITVQEVKQYFYFAYNKPHGIESTQNKSIKNNLAEAVNLTTSFFPLGRLDKESDGLMILTNDGSIYKEVTSSKVEKEYVVEVDSLLTNEALLELANGVEILGRKTNTAIVEQLDTHVFKIILKQGLNRQIRRMCYKLGYEVISLTRTRIGNLSLGNLSVGEKMEIERSEIFAKK